MVREHVSMLLLLSAARFVGARQTVQELVQLSADVGTPTGVQVSEAVQKGERICRRMSRFVPGARCLHQAAATRVWLAAHGIPSEIVVGFRHQEQFAGHAWLELPDGDELFNDEARFHEVWRG